MEIVSNRVSDALNLITFGEVEDGLKKLEQTAENPFHICSIKSEINAFKCDWEKVATYSSSIILHPESLNTSNIFFEHCELLSIAGLETNRWETILESVIGALPLYQKPLQIAQRYTLEKIKKLASSNLTVKDWKKIRKAMKSKTVPTSDFQGPNDAGVIESFKLYPTKFWAAFEGDTGLDLLHYLYGEAAKFNSFEQTIKIYENFGLGSLIYHLYNVALAYLKLDKKQEAWKVIEHNIFLYSSEDTMMVLPTELLRDFAIRDLMNSDRREFILRTPKGSLAFEKKPEFFSRINELNSLTAKEFWHIAKSVLR